MDTAEASAVTVKGRFCGAPSIASGGYIAGLLGRWMEGPVRVSLEGPVPVDHPFTIERLLDGGVALTDGATMLAHAVPAQPDRRVMAADQHQTRLRRQRRDEEFERRPAGPRRERFTVVEDQDDRTSLRVRLQAIEDLIEQTGE